VPNRMNLGQPTFRSTIARPHDRLHVGEPLGEPIDVLHVIVEDRHVERREPGEARESVQRVEIVIEDRGRARGTRRAQTAGRIACCCEDNRSRADLAQARAQ